MSRHTGHGHREPVEWEPDLLGDPWRRTSVALPPIRGERVIATLVASTTTLASTPASCDAHPSTQSTAVLYLHGFNDYLFSNTLKYRLILRNEAILDLTDTFRYFSKIFVFAIKPLLNKLLL